MPTPDQNVTELREELASLAAKTPEQLKVKTDAEIVANKELRVGLDLQLQKLKSLPASRERAHSITKIQEAIMWLGMDLKRLSDVNPYPNSYKPENTVVDKTADNLKL